MKGVIGRETIERLRHSRMIYLSLQLRPPSRGVKADRAPPGAPTPHAA